MVELDELIQRLEKRLTRESTVRDFSSRLKISPLCPNLGLSYAFQ